MPLISALPQSLRPSHCPRNHYRVGRTRRRMGPTVRGRHRTLLLRRACINSSKNRQWRPLSKPLRASSWTGVAVNASKHNNLSSLNTLGRNPIKPCNHRSMRLPPRMRCRLPSAPLRQLGQGNELARVVPWISEAGCSQYATRVIRLSYIKTSRRLAREHLAAFSLRTTARTAVLQLSR